MFKHQVSPMGYYDTYVALVPETDVLAGLSASLELLEQLDTVPLRQLSDQVYAPGKWTIRDIFQHISDCERIMSYRALRFARQDRTPLPSFDENTFAAHAGACKRSLTAILTELQAIRQASIHLFKSFDEESLLQSGPCFNQEVSVLAFGFIIAGHQQHHLNIIRERYLPLLTKG